MSHANGEIWSEDGKRLGFFEYNGTVDCVCTRIYKDKVDLKVHWRGDNWRECTCGGRPSPVILYTDYGFGSHWAGEACFACEAITDGVFDFDSRDGHPFLTEHMILEYGRVLPCPKCKELEKAPLACVRCGRGFNYYGDSFSNTE